ncbi:MAG TPA: dolichol-phosphate mannosyltransferase [Cyanobacteria bacterium UBA11149]|nr:dolichol-phosphate mannosyltransferase [Cyanobacteria bacterium UBA11367]HBE56362.1 dolichol-phosphate mannosyltransferase [Cyanobacteria bacterium UBA11366]HBK64218.1 dolichol-phosphate mannosyltransferase [Cyanobacteria bacterium UBA11166]HBR72789.1 dolichol-phosphate mannosyltransferase [Cyanobacteria bacterium UBA11159]HBS69894.1 dolichol-phosphate mannosyltransferase [Cyanobacteria bacterium UBA11153]HBW91805.1 dolichol-phosphate mannosyltransferase [Cyanobacteria bacterium UBA11149]H
MKIKPDNLPLIIIGFGILFSLYLQGQIPEGVFFSGDAGLKALLAKQLSIGQFRFDLAPPSETWVRNLWQEGLYPFQEPFVYNFNNRYYITFPFTFPLITAPFYALFGYRGFYVIPLVATWAMWVSFYFACQRLNLTRVSTAIALLILIFASPLSIYSAMYWEHSLAVFLAFHGAAMLLIPKRSQSLSKQEAILSGIFMGSAVWFRPEFLCLAFLLIILVYFIAISNWSNLSFLNNICHLSQLSWLSQRKEIFLVSTLVTIGIFFLWNQLIYGHPLGIHAIQVVAESLSQRLLDGWKNFQGLGLTSFVFFPLAFFAIIYLQIACVFSPDKVSLNLKTFSGYAIYLVMTFMVLALLTDTKWRLIYSIGSLGYLALSLLVRTKIKFTGKMTLVYLSCLLFNIGVSLLVPVGTSGLIAGGKQWGARFLLILIPMIALLVVTQLESIWKNNPQPIKYSLLCIVSILLILGISQNSYQAKLFLKKNHQGILPALEILDKDPNQVIAMSHQFVAQALQPGLKQDKLFLRAEDSDKLVKLGQALVEQGQNKFTYICYPHEECHPPSANPDTLKFDRGNQRFAINLKNLGTFGKYPIYEANIIQQ